MAAKLHVALGQPSYTCAVQPPRQRSMPPAARLHCPWWLVSGCLKSLTRADVAAVCSRNNQLVHQPSMPVHAACCMLANDDLHQHWRCAVTGSGPTGPHPLHFSNQHTSALHLLV